MMTATRTQWHIIGRGLNGWHAAAPLVSSSGGSLDPYVWHGNGTQQPGYAREAIDGCPVYDASEADVSAFSRFIISGPMCEPALPADGWRKFGHDDDEPKSLDTVGVGRYLAMLRAAVPGVRYGIIHGGEVVWD